MPQNSVLYGVARVRFHEKNLLSRDRMARLIDAGGQEAIRLLLDAGYGDLPEATLDDAERLIDSELEKTYALIREVTFNSTVTDVFFLQADVHNLKLLLKRRLTDSRETSGYLHHGVYPLEALTRMVESRDYSALPVVFAEALDALERSFSESVDPVLLSVALDSAYIRYALSVKNDFIQAYFKALADFNNVLTLLRLKAMEQSEARLKQVLLPAGEIPHDALIRAFAQPLDGVARYVCVGAAKDALRSALNAISGGAPIAVLERERDDYLMALCRPAKYETESITPLIGYMLAREQEAECLRIILTAKRNGLPGSIITERMRALYV